MRASKKHGEQSQRPEDGAARRRKLTTGILRALGQARWGISVELLYAQFAPGMTEEARRQDQEEINAILEVLVQAGMVTMTMHPSSSYERGKRRFHNSGYVRLAGADSERTEAESSLVDPRIFPPSSRSTPKYSS